MPDRLPSLNSLRAFEAAARHLSFAGAAQELHVTPAAVSQLIKQLENDLGVVLFKRGKTLTLSDAAAAVATQLTEAFEQITHVSDRLRGHDQNGPLVISAPPTFAARWFISRMEDFESRHPAVGIRLLATQRVVDFTVENIDVAIRFGSGPFNNLYSEKLLPEQIILVAAPTIARNLKNIQDLPSLTLLHDESHDWDSAFPSWQTWLQSLEISIAQPLRIRHFSDMNLVIQAAINEIGVALVWQSLVLDDIRDGRLVTLFDKNISTLHNYHLVIPRNRMHLEKVKIFRDWLLQKVNSKQ